MHDNFVLGKVKREASRFPNLRPFTADISKIGDIAKIAKIKDPKIAITLPPVLWGCNYEAWVLTVRQYCPLGPHGRAHFESLVKRARQKDDARELKEFYQGAATYVSHRKSADFLT